MTQPENDLSTCAICGDAALFTDNDPGANPVSYCTTHVPEHLRGRALSGQMPLQDGSTVDELMAEAQRLDIEGRSSMNKAQLQTAVSAARLTEEVAVREGRVPDRPVDPADPDRPTPPAPRRAFPDEPVRPTAEETQELVEQGGEDTSMSDAPAEVPEVHDHAVETAADADADAAAEDEAPKKASRKGSRKK